MQGTLPPLWGHCGLLADTPRARRSRPSRAGHHPQLFLHTAQAFLHLSQLHRLVVLAHQSGQFLGPGGSATSSLRRPRAYATGDATATRGGGSECSDGHYDDDDYWCRVALPRERRMAGTRDARPQKCGACSRRLPPPQLPQTKAP
jgi:hypothetical protein